MKRALALMLMGLGAASPAEAGHFDPRRHKAEIAGPPSQVLVLGSAHLSEMPGSFRVEFLEPLLDHLAAFDPQLITVEAISGQDCEVLQRFPALYGNAYGDYCWGTAEAEKATGLSVPRALAAVERTFAKWPVSPSPSERRRLASIFLAANDRASAQVQWLRLDPAERHAGDGLTTELVKILERRGGKLNENYDVAAKLAARLGLERVYVTDDHSADAIVANANEAFGTALGQLRTSTVAQRARADYKRRVSGLTDGRNVLEFYRYLNAPSTQGAVFAGDFGAAARQETPELYGRQYLAWWETRNLRMVANIRATFGPRPGIRVLSIVGASHKPYIDAYLEMMQDVEVVDAAHVLK